MSLPSRGSEFLAGVRAELPLLLGVAPFGMAYGAYAVEQGMSSPLALAMSSVIFGGASQFVAVRLITASEPAMVIVFAVWLVNLRHMLYSASLAPHLRHLPARWRAVIAYLLTDEAYVVGAARYQTGHPAPRGHWFVLGACAALWTCWQITTAIGVGAGAAVPASWELEFALPLTFIAIIAPALRDRPSFAAAAVAGGVAVVGFGWPYSTGLFAAAIAGMAAGLALERASGAKPPHAVDAAPVAA
jgi:4-azaleucine resistance transporter AzlC